MKSSIKYSLLLLPLFLQSCAHLFNKCGDNVLLGEYTVTQESLDNWLPYRDQEQLIFRNSEDETLVLERILDTSFFQVLSGKTLCWEDAWDTSSEYIRGEWIVSKFEGNGLKLETALFLNLEMTESYSTIESLYDHVSFYSLDGNMGGTLDLVASDRGNTQFDTERVFYPSYIFADSIEINGQLFYDVWYFNREDPSDVFTPTLFVKKGYGIIAFGDAEHTVWLRNL